MKFFYSLVNCFLFINFVQAQCDFTSVGPDDRNQASYDIADFRAITIDKTGAVYVSYCDYSQGLKISVQKYNGSSWAILGNPGISQTQVNISSICTDNANVPYVAYSDISDSNKIKIKKFDGTAWIKVGGINSFKGNISHKSIVIDNTDTCYVVYTDANNYVTAIKYDPATDNWVNAGFPGISLKEASIAIDNSGTPYVVFKDFFNSSKLTVKKYSGNSWQVVGTAGFTYATNGYPVIAIDKNNTPHVVCSDTLGFNVKKFDGTNWVSTGNSGYAPNPNYYSIEIGETNIPYVAYYDYAVVIKKCSAGNWLPVGNLEGSSSGAAGYPALAADSSGVIYTSNYTQTKTQIFKYKDSIWTIVGDRGFGEASYNDPVSLIIDRKGTPHVSFAEGGRATVKKYNGSNWEAVGNSGFSPTEANNIAFAIDTNEIPYVAFKYPADGHSSVMKYNGTNWVELGNLDGGQYPSIAISNDGLPYVAAQYQGYLIVVHKYNGSFWEIVGGSGFDEGSALLRTSVAFDSYNTPYVASTSSSRNYKATVMKFNGSTWVAAGNPGFSQGAAEDISLAIDASGIPYVAYRDGGNNYKATVMKLSGTNWIAVGSPGFSQGGAKSTSITIDASGTPYVAYEDESNGNKATLMKYDASNWVVVGCSGFSSSPINSGSISLALNSTGTPYVAYLDQIPYAGAGVWAKTLGEELAKVNTAKKLKINPPFSGLFKNGGDIICTVKPSVTNSISDSTNAKVWIEAFQPAEFVKRHYEIAPATNINTATGRVILYFKQAEFDSFNAKNIIKLPSSSADITGKANLLIEKRSGISNNGTGFPGTYTGNVITINPVDADIIWNAAASRWEVSFDVTGFGSFFIKTKEVPLPDAILYTFTGSGNWNSASNWSYGILPPNPLANGSAIVIDYAAGGNCILNIAQTISVGSSITIASGKNLTILGNLIIQ